VKDALLSKCKALGFTLEWLCISASPAESVHLVDTGARPGITFITKRYAEELALTKAAYVPFADGEIAYEYGVAYRQSDHRVVLNEFLQYLVERCRPPHNYRGRRKPNAQVKPKLNGKAAG
jgi:hypothetical protein